MAFLEVFWTGRLWARRAAGFFSFLGVMVGDGRGVAGPKELMGLGGAVTGGRAYSPPTPRSVVVEAFLVFIIITGKARAKENTYKWVSV